MAFFNEDWFRIMIRDKVKVRLADRGGHLDGTMMKGDGHAGEIKFPRIGNDLQAYEITNTIQPVRDRGVQLDTISVKLRDFELPILISQIDMKRDETGMLKDSVAKVMTKAIRRKRDDIKWEALTLFAENVADVKKHDKSASVIDLLDTRKMRSYVAAHGDDDEGEMFLPLPASAFDQLMMYKEFSNADYVGPSDLPFAMSGRSRRKTREGVHYFECPDRLFGIDPTQPEANDPATFDTFCWSMECMGCETEWDQELPKFYERPDLEGTPIMAKVNLSTAAVGIEPRGVVRGRFKFDRDLVRPA